MIRTRTFSRLGSATVLVSLALALLVPPAAAAGATRWVDDDGKAGAAGCGGTAKVFKSVQKAIDASGTQDVVKVCPGTYIGKVRIQGARTGLVLQSVTPRQATLRAPAANGLSGAIVTVDGVDGVTVKGFAIRTLRFPDCDALSGISAGDAKSISVTGNDLRSVHPDTSRSCLFTGIHASGGTTGRIAENRIKDFLEDGIHLTGSGTDVLVKSNTIISVHAPFNAAFGSGVNVYDGAVGRVRLNLITDTASPRGFAGIRLGAAASATVVVGNTVTGSASGIRADEVNDVLIEGNTVSGAQVGINLLDAQDLDVHTNVSSDNSVHGIHAALLASGNDIRGNTAQGNTDKDCIDDSFPVDNTWVDNDGDDNWPADLCGDLDPVP